MTAPVLDNSVSPSLPTTLENATSPAGITVAAFVVDDSITDPDGAVEAIAITGLDTSLGTWQYSVDLGASWLTIRSDLINSATNELALLLGPTASIRLLPFAELNGTLAEAITFRAWDQSTGAEGDYVAITATGGTTAFSVDSDTASLEITAVNDAPTFAAGSGKATTDAGATDSAASVAVQPDGKIVVAGFSTSSGTADFAVVRYNADGSLDSSFAGSGVLVLPVGSAFDIGASVTLQPDGKIVVAGRSTDGSYSDFSLVRLNADGSLDETFDGDGKVVLPAAPAVNYNDGAQSVTVQLDGKILAAGYGFNGNTMDFTLVRLDADGSLDTSFNSAGSTPGIVVTEVVSAMRDEGYGVAVQPDGKILVAGTSNNDFALVRYNVDGSLDTSFNSTGTTPGTVVADIGSATTDSARSVAVQPDGKIVVAGSSNGDFAVVRYDADGGLDMTFGSGGMLLLPVGSGTDAAYSVTLQPDGKILVAGTSNNGSNDDFALVRLEANGILDTSFGAAGKLVLPVGSAADAGYSVAVQADGKIVVTGASNNSSNNDFALVRLNADGSLDTTFNSNDSLGGSVFFAENGDPVALDSAVAIYDTELAALAGGAGNYSGASLTLSRNGGANSDDVFSGLNNLSLSAGNVVLSSATVGTYTNSGGELTISFGADATQAIVNEVLSSIGYANSSSTPPTTAQIDWVFSDGMNTGTGSTTVNLILPPAPVVTSITDDVGPGTDPVASGASTNDTTPTLVGTAEPGVTIEVFEGATSLGTTTADGSGDWSLTPGTPLEPSETPYSFTATARDAQDNVSVPSAAYTVLVDTTPPAAPEITSVTDWEEPGTGTVASGDSTNAVWPSLEGTAEPGSTVNVYDGATLLGSTTADALGDWWFDPSDPLSQGAHSFTAMAVDAAGNGSSASAGYDITIDESTVCFLKGTRIQTPGGEVAVQDLAIGDLVATASGGTQPVKWIGRRSYVTRFLASHGRRNVLPVRIARGAIADNLPRRDLFVSPEHALCIDGVLVPARHLVNGRSIAYHEALDTIEYYHIELPQHDVLLAEGAAAESWLDCGNRNFFMNVVDYLALSLPDQGLQQPCHPLLAAGPHVEAVRARLAQRAHAIGFGMTTDPDLHLVADGQRVDASSTDGLHFHFALASRPSTLSVGSRSVTPADVNPMSSDRRPLGVSVTHIILRSAGTELRIAHSHPMLSDGFHAAEAGHRWSTGQATIPRSILDLLTGDVEVEVHVAGLAMKYPLEPAGVVRPTQQTPLRLVA